MDDLISRKALLEELDKWINPCVNCESEFPSGIATAISEVEAAPAVDAEPVVHGRWEEIRNPYGELEGWLCKCGREVTSYDNYCPSCGAKMDGGNDDEN